MSDVFGYALHGTAELLRHAIAVLPFLAYYFELVSFEWAVLFGVYIVIFEVVDHD